MTQLLHRLRVLAACGVVFAACGDSSPDDPGRSSDAAAPVDDAARPVDAPAEAADAPAARADADVVSPDAPIDGAFSTDGPPEDPGGSLRFSGLWVRKALPNGRRLVVMLEKPLPLRTDYGFPSRSVRWIEADGSVVWSRGSSRSRYLLDFAVHPSGRASLLFGAAEGYSIERVDGDGKLLGVHVISDPAIDTDAPDRPPPAGPIETTTLDTARLASVGEDVIVATRTGRHSVIAYRFGYEGGDDFPQRYRTVVVPPLSMPPIGLTGGSYDTFDLVGAQYAVHVAVGLDEIAYVGVRYPDLGATNLRRVHEQIFDEALAGDPDALDSYVTRLSPKGERLGTSVISTDGPDELQSLRAVSGGVWVAGRTETWNAQGTGHDAFLAQVEATTGRVALRRLDIDRGDVAFDVMPLETGGVIVVGATGYTQNPNGLSVSEPSRAFARFIPTTGPARDWPLPRSLRHDEARSIVPFEAGRLLVGGMLDGPGTHSGDGDPALVRADGFLVDLPLGGR